MKTLAFAGGEIIHLRMQERLISKAAQNGDKLTVAEAKAEIAADFTELIFADENTLRTFVEANSKTLDGRNLLQRLADAIRRIIASLKKTEVSVNAEAASKMGLGSVIDRLEQAEKLFREALKEGGQQRSGVSGDGRTQYSFLGEKAKVANYSRLDKAIKLESEGKATSEEVRQQTGWFKGYDGKWRFEIDDSNSEFLLPKMIETAKAKAQAKVDKITADYKAGKIGKAAYENRIYQAKYRAGSSFLMRDFVRGDYTLGQILKHPKLYAAYPELKNVRVVFSRLGDGVRGSTSTAYSNINLHENSYYRPNETKETLLHEIQHQIQEIEGFASGSSPAYYDDISDGMTAYEQYYNTAGEIEARDVANRRALSAEERKNARPDIDRTDVVFADAISDNGKNVSIKQAMTEYGFEEPSKETRNNLKLQGVEVIDSKKVLVERIEAAVNGIERQKQFTLGAISNDTKAKIEADTQQKLFKDRQYSFIVDSDDFVHISKHFSDSEKIADEVVRLFDVIAHYDNVKFEQAGNQKTLIFNKKYSHADIRSVEVVSNNRNSLNLVTVFYTKKNKSQSNPAAISNDSDSPRWGSTLNENIPQPDPSVKSQQSTFGGSLRDLAKQYGEIAPGENPAREVHLPKKTSKRKNVSEIIRTILEAKVTPDMLVPDLETMVEQGVFSYEAYGDDAAVKKARDKIATDAGWEDAKREWFASVRSGKISKDLTAMGWVLYNNAANIGAIDTAITILTEMVGHQRNAAQALQATRILKKLDPESQLYAVVRSVDNLKRELEKKYGDKAPDLKIDKVFAQRLLEATDQKTRDAAMADIYREVGRQMPSNFLDKWNAWRYLAMLGNPRTHVRNIVGNAAFVPLVGAKNVVATGLEKAVYTFGGQRLQRTKGIPTKELLMAAYKDYSNLTDKELAGEKYNDNANANAWIEEGRQIFGQKTKFGKGVEALRKGNSELLSKEDEWFVKPHYALALAQYCKANGITAQMIAAGKGLDGARQYAIKEAQKATYRDANAVSEAVSKIGKYKGDNVALKAGSLFVDAVLPFRKTPANILVRAVEYSPVGLIKSVTADLVRMKQGKINGAQVIDNLAAGLTGTALMGLGVLLSKLGLVIGMGSDDEDERRFNELQGYQGYAIVFDDRTYTVDWLAPEAMPFFVGVNLAELKAFKEANVSEMLSALTNITAPMLEMSCLQGLNDMIEAAGSVQSKGVSAMMQMVSNAATSYLTQALPTLFGQVERVTESTRQQTYADKGNKVLTPNMQYTLGKAFNKLPGDVGQIPYIDAWGRETSTGNVGARAFNNLLNPGYSVKIRTSPMEKELQRLFDETGEKSVLPDRADKYITVGGEKIDLNKNQYVKYAKVRGQTAYDMLTKITASAQYKALDEQSKVDLISKVYSYANAIAKAEVTKTQQDKALRYQPDGWIEKAVATSKATGIPAWKYVLIYNGQPRKGVEDEKGETIPLSPSLVLMEYLYSFIGLSDAQRQALYADFGVAKSVRHYDRQRVAQELKKMKAK